MEAGAAEGGEREAQPFVLRQRYPLKDNADLVARYRQMDADDIATMVPLAVRMVEQWEFDGDPADPASYEMLDVVSEAWPLFRAINTFWFERVAGAPKKPPSAGNSSSSR